MSMITLKKISSLSDEDFTKLNRISLAFGDGLRIDNYETNFLRSVMGEYGLKWVLKNADKIIKEIKIRIKQDPDWDLLLSETDSPNAYKKLVRELFDSI